MDVKLKMNFAVRANSSSIACKVLPSTLGPPFSLSPPSSPLPHQGVILLDLPADEVMAGEECVLKKERKGKEGKGHNR